MSKSVMRRAGVAVTALAVIAGVAGCQGDDKKAADAPAAKARTQDRTAATKALTAAYEKTSEAKSAKVRMTMTMPASMEGGGDFEMTGVMGWEPTLMDMTVKGDAFQSEPGDPEQMRMLMVDNVMYMDMGAEAAKDMDGKRWMKMDIGAIAEQSGDKELQKQMTGGLENMNQDPSQQLAVLLDSPNLKHVGSEKVGGVDTDHYKGSLTVAEMIDANGSLDVLSDEERKSFLEGVEKAGIEGYDIEVWVDGDGYPAKMNVGMDSPEGAVTIVSEYSDYGAKATVQTPPAGETVDLMEMLGEIGEGLGAAEDAQSDSAAS
ncbi:hypothetical protein [Streptomyces genisteinicus]|uniref:Lipoprotein n=1 Tax=Streptomyces genisteinicus TaxID=2768068 RepID=A0A7H0HW20_9ACTN|nr:hypothetical protein [Streptomyces genisteinicus]QNP64736.1 hypothetical protein IAG43_18665 [Streptomyces genisteinicus]